MPYTPRTRMLFCDWHMPSFLPEVKIDYDEYFEQIRRTGAQTLIFQVKTAHGAAFAPTEVGITNPTMHGDLFGEIATRAKAQGLEFIAYYNMVLSWELHRLHPEWEQQGRDHQPLRMFMYPCFCMSNDEFRDHVCAHMAEVTARYPIDGWFLDLQYFAPEGCFCPACEAKFAAQVGYELRPEAFGTSQWLDLLDYQVRTREAFIHASMDACNPVKPGLSWSWNGSGNTVAISPTLHVGADYLSTEAHPPEYLHADVVTRHCQGLRKPFTLFMPESQGSWGDWTVTTPETIKGLSAIALAHGGSLNINHVPYPCGDYGGKVPGVVWDTIAEVFDWVAQREALCMGRRPVPVAACLHSPDNIRLLQALARDERYSHLGWEVYANEHALAQLLMETHIPWEMRPEDIPLEKMRRYELLLVPYQPHVSEDLAARLREYVRLGGKLLAGYHTSLLGPRGEWRDNFVLADLFGADLQQESPYSVCYLDRLDDMLTTAVPQMPLLIKDSASGALNPKNHALYCRPRAGTRILARIMDPIIESDFDSGHYVYHDHAPPGHCTEYPAITLCRYGAGQVAYLPVPFFKAFAAKKSPFLKALFRALVQRIFGVPQRVRIEAPVSVKAALMEDEAGWLLHLIHLQKETDSMYVDGSACSGPVRVRVRPGWAVAAVQDCLSREALACEEDGEWTRFEVLGVRDHTIVRIARSQT